MSLIAIQKLNRVLAVALVASAVITFFGVRSADKEITHFQKAPIVAYR